MKNYIMTRNYGKIFKFMAIIFVVLAVVTAVAIPLSLSRQIGEAAALEKQQATDAAGATQTDDGRKNDGKEHDENDHGDAWKSQLTPLSAMNYAIIGAAIVLWSVLVLSYWLSVVAWLYKSAVNEKMNRSLWPILGVFFNILAVGAFCIVRDQPKRS